ncbi:hypothetical protein XANMN_17630 [Xanthomonas phaseoli pv. manihotis str. CIO151]|nr:hypothetical protein XANMN_17630 [Xanthomonas phaseoli pv. manihotis str. CIO151]
MYTWYMHRVLPALAWLRSRFTGRTKCGNGDRVRLRARSMRLAAMGRHAARRARAGQCVQAVAWRSANRVRTPTQCGRGSGCRAARIGQRKMALRCFGTG